MHENYLYLPNQDLLSVLQVLESVKDDSKTWEDEQELLSHQDWDIAYCDMWEQRPLESTMVKATLRSLGLAADSPEFRTVDSLCVLAQKIKTEEKERDFLDENV